ncbi:MAG: ATP-binding protein [Mycoplasmataceae bacterium]|nr:ATP-binding protein [Mycoplasmataceae bacterium]
MELLREKYLDILEQKRDNGIAKAIVGVRRCGKSTLLLQFINKHFGSIESKNIMYLDLEDYTYHEFLDLDFCFNKIKERIEKSKQKLTIFIDEIDRITDKKNTPNAWKYIITSFYKKADLYVTSSNSKILDKNTELVGRIDKIFVFPLSFSEYCQYKNFKNISQEEKFFSYLKEGGFPLIINFDERERKQQISQLDAEIQVRDLQPELWNKGLKISDNTISLIKKYLYQQIGTNTSINNICNNLKSNFIKIWNEDLSIVVDSLINSYLLYKVERYDVHGHEILKTDWKLYVNDHSFRNIYLTNFKQNLGSLLENVVYFELLRRGYRVYIGKNKDSEIDFVAKLNEEEIIYYQVTVELNENNMKKEYKSLQVFDRAQKIILSLDKDESTDEKGIIKKNIIDWLLEK